MSKICGDITDPEGAVVDKAQVLLQANSYEAEILEQVNSSPMGEFALKERSVGTYELIVKSPGFQPFLGVIHVEDINSTGVCEQPIHIRLGVL